MRFLYFILSQLVQGLLPVANWFIQSGKSKTFIEAQRKKIPSTSLIKKGKRYWFHCASLGEFEQARPVIEALKKQSESNSIVITFFSPSGFQQRKDYPLADVVMYLPIDGPNNAKDLIAYLQADAVVFVKYELWYFYLNALFKKGTPVYLISAVFRKNHFIFKPWGRFIGNLLPKFSGIFVQDKNSLDCLQARGLKQVFLSGDTRYDRVMQLAKLADSNPIIERFKGQNKLIILGSSWPEEEQIIQAYLQKNTIQTYKILIAPHDISEQHIQEIKTRFTQEKVKLYTEVDKGASDILILNTIGHLASAYLYADFAFIGGGFGKGLHNILEALSYGVPVVFGPQVDKYPEANLSIEAGIAQVVSNLNEFEQALKSVMIQSESGTIQLACKDFIAQQSGATEMVLNVIQ